MQEDNQQQIDSTVAARRQHRLDIVHRHEVEKFFEESRKSREEMLNIVNELTVSVGKVKEDLDEFRESTKELMEVFKALQGVSSVLLWIGKMIKPIAWVAGAITAVTLYMQGVRIPKLTS